MGAFTMSADLLYDLENKLQAADSEADYDGIMTDRIAENQEWVDSLTA
jgi:glycine betaine/proline transport system substrate-binding protein